VDFRRLAVVEPGVVKHEPDVINVLPWVSVLASVELTFDQRQIHRLLYYLKVVLHSTQLT